MTRGFATRCSREGPASIGSDVSAARVLSTSAKRELACGSAFGCCARSAMLRCPIETRIRLDRHCGRFSSQRTTSSKFPVSRSQARRVGGKASRQSRSLSTDKKLVTRPRARSTLSLTRGLTHEHRGALLRRRRRRRRAGPVAGDLPRPSRALRPDDTRHESR